MDVLLRERRTRPDGFVEFTDTEISEAAVNVGSAPDQTLQLIGRYVAPRHAQLRLAGDALRIDCRRGRRVSVNGKSVASSALVEGDVVEIDGHRIQIVAAPPGFDVALELTPNSNVRSGDFERAFVTDLERTWLPKRSAAWILFVSVLALTLLVPLGKFVWQSNTENPSPLAHWDKQWSAGPLHPAHLLATGDDCNTCHAIPFVRVRDEECSKCHDRTRDHVEMSLASRADLEHVRCATCHHEHDDPPHLVISANGLCTDCHAQPERFAKISKLPPTEGFSMTTHPKFDARLLRPVRKQDGGFSFDWRVEKTAIEGARETSNLKFPHDVHLEKTKVRRLDDGEALGCGDCHRLSRDGRHFEPITMEANCRACHDLKFDPTDPTRELPHGKPMDAILTIEGHYLRKFSDPNRDNAVQTRRRLPDRPDVDERCTDSAYNCAIKKSREEAVNQFTLRGCITCHVVEDTQERDLYSRFQVYPIRLVTDYLPKAQFAHGPHLTLRDKTGDDACEACHPARRSKDSADLHIPDIDTCAQCHSQDVAERSDERGVVLPCIGCHAYHPREMPGPRANMRSADAKTSALDAWIHEDELTSDVATVFDAAEYR